MRYTPMLVMRNRAESSQSSRQFYQEWVIVLAIVLLAALLRFWQIGDLPFGLYHDEAFNGLDALGVLDGERPIFFEANNGREPLYIYMVSLAVQIFGRTSLAIRIPAAIIGTLTTIPLYFLIRTWFNRHIALITIFLWATTVWPIHLSRIGFRTILLPFFLTLAAALFSVALQKHRRDGSTSATTRLLLLTGGIAYGLSFYTYLAARLSIVVVAVGILVYWWAHRPPRLGEALLTSGLASFVVVLPLALVLLGQGDAGRTGQVSILSPDVNGGDLIGTLWSNFGRTLGMFFLKGDTILRHNPPGRPVFDWLLTLPFLIGAAVTLRNLQKPVYFLITTWVAIMLTGTLFAEDAPHFLRAAGILPVILIFPAIGLSRLSNWSKLPSALTNLLVGALLLGSCAVTFNDYFLRYAQQPDTRYLFEGAARELAEHAEAEVANGVSVLLDERFAVQWQSIPFLLPIKPPVETFTVESISKRPPDLPATLFVWPYETTEFMPSVVSDAAAVEILQGALSRTDFEPTAYPLYVRYRVATDWPAPVDLPGRSANFDNQIGLRSVSAEISADHRQLTVDLNWSTLPQHATPLTAFIHVIDKESGALLAQDDQPPGGSYWPFHWWRPELFVIETRIIGLSQAFDTDQHLLKIGVYDSATQTRLPLWDENGQTQSDQLSYSFE